MTIIIESRAVSLSVCVHGYKLNSPQYYFHVPSRTPPSEKTLRVGIKTQQLWVFIW